MTRKQAVAAVKASVMASGSRPLSCRDAEQVAINNGLIPQRRGKCATAPGSQLGQAVEGRRYPRGNHG